MDSLNFRPQDFNDESIKNTLASLRRDRNDPYPKIDQVISGINAALKKSLPLNDIALVDELRSMIKNVNKFTIQSQSNYTEKISRFFITFEKYSFTCSCDILIELKRLSATSVWDYYLENHTTLNKSGSHSQDLFIKSREELRGYLSDCGEYLDKLFLSELLDSKVMKKLDDSSLQSFLTLCPNLKTLELEKAKFLTDKALGVISNCCTSLENLKLTDSKYITLSGVKQLALRRPQLIADFSFCRFKKELDFILEESPSSYSRNNLNTPIYTSEAKKISSEVEIVISSATSLPKSSPHLPIRQTNRLDNLGIPLDMHSNTTETSESEGETHKSESDDGETFKSDETSTSPSPIENVPDQSELFFQFDE